MLCQNCGKNEANVKYTQIVNGIKKQMTLCENCAKNMGIEDAYFNMPITFSDFLGDIFTNDSFIPEVIKTNKLECKNCGMEYDNFIKLGKFGCSECCNTFEDKLDLLLKNIHGSNRHVGRLGKITKTDEIKINKTKDVKTEKENKSEDKLESLKQKLKEEIREERYEDAAMTRDEIRRLDKKGE